MICFQSYIKYTRVVTAEGEALARKTLRDRSEKLEVSRTFAYLFRQM